MVGTIWSSDGAEILEKDLVWETGLSGQLCGQEAISKRPAKELCVSLNKRVSLMGETWSHAQTPFGAWARDWMYVWS